MNAPKIEELISKGTKHKVVNGKTLFYVSSIKKKYPKATIHETDIVEEDDVKLIELANVKF